MTCARRSPACASRLEEARMGPVRSVADYEQAIEAAITEAQGLLGTFSALLRIAQVEAGAQRAAFRQVDLSALAETVAEAFAPVAEDESLRSPSRSPPA